MICNGAEENQAHHCDNYGLRVQEQPLFFGHNCTLLALFLRAVFVFISFGSHDTLIFIIITTSLITDNVTTQSRAAF